MQVFSLLLLLSCFSILEWRCFVNDLTLYDLLSTDIQAYISFIVIMLLASSHLIEFLAQDAKQKTISICQ